MDRPNTPSQPPMYSQPPSYCEDEQSPSHVGQSASDGSQIRLLTSQDDVNSRPYVSPTSIERPVEAHTIKKPALSTSSSPYLTALRQVEEALGIPPCKLQGQKKQKPSTCLTPLLGHPAENR